MSLAVRRAFGLILAFAVAYGMVAVIAALAQSTLPGGQVSNGAQLEAAMEAGRIPFNVLLLVLGGWWLAAYIGGTIAFRMSGEQGPALLFAALFTVYIITVLATVTHPTWMWVGGLLGVPIFALGAAKQRITLSSR